MLKKISSQSNKYSFGLGQRENIIAVSKKFVNQQFGTLCSLVLKGFKLNPMYILVHEKHVKGKRDELSFGLLIR